jgi:DnaJ family protein A protein 2
MKVSIRQLGPNMIQQMQHVCTDCKGSGPVNCSCYSGISLLLLSATDHHLVVESLKVLVLFLAGEVINEKDKCGQCKGQKVVQDKKTLEVHVEKGMQHGQKITFQGEADEAVWSCPQRSHTQKFSILFGSLSLFCCVSSIFLVSYISSLPFRFC